jgi:hypothetical protein
MIAIANTPPSKRRKASFDPGRERIRHTTDGEYFISAEALVRSHRVFRRYVKLDDTQQRMRFSHCVMEFRWVDFYRVMRREEL